MLQDSFCYFFFLFQIFKFFIFAVQILINLFIFDQVYRIMDLFMWPNAT